MNLRDQFIEDWEYTRAKTLAFLMALPDDKLGFSPQKGLGTIGQQLRHLADVQKCYIDGIREGVMDFSKKPKDKALEKDKQKLINYFKLLGGELRALLEDLGPTEIQHRLEWKEQGNPNIYAALLYMKEHEVFHQGMLEVAARLAGAKTVKFF